jgi:type I restriction enzyme R subunit
LGNGFKRVFDRNFLIIAQLPSATLIFKGNRGKYKGIKLAVVEAKSDKLAVSEGVAQAKLYAQKLNLETTYSTNGNEIYQICLKTGEEKRVEDFLSPQALWEKTYSDQNDWREQFASIP